MASQTQLPSEWPTRPCPPRPACKDAQQSRSMRLLGQHSTGPPSHLQTCTLASQTPAAPPGSRQRGRPCPGHRRGRTRDHPRCASKPAGRAPTGQARAATQRRCHRGCGKRAHRYAASGLVDTQTARQAKRVRIALRCIGVRTRAELPPLPIALSAPNGLGTQEGRHVDIHSPHAQGHIDVAEVGARGPLGPQPLDGRERRGTGDVDLGVCPAVKALGE